MQHLRLSRVVAFFVIPLGAAIVVPLAYYLFVSVPARERYLSEHAFRSLAVTAEQVQIAVASYASAVKNVATTLGDPTDEDEPSKQVRKVRDRIDLVPGLQYVKNAPGCEPLRHVTQSGSSPTPPAANWTIRLVPDAAAPVQAGSARESVTTLSEYSRPHRARWMLYFRYHCPETNEIGGDGCGQFGGDVCAKLSVEELFDTVMGDSGPPVMDRFLAIENGTVVFQAGTSGFWFEEIPSVASQVKAPGPTPTPTHAGGASATLTMEVLTRSTALSEVERGGIGYKIFSHPVRISVATRAQDFTTDSRPPVWVVGGIMPKDRFRNAVRAVSFTPAGVIPLALIVGLLVWPGLKIWAMGSRDRLKAFDVHYLSIGAVLGTALTTLLLLDAHAYVRLKAAMDDEMRQFAQKLEADFRSELRSAYTALEEYREQHAYGGERLATLAANASADPGAAGPWRSFARMAAKPHIEVSIFGSPRPEIDPSPPDPSTTFGQDLKETLRDTYPYFEMLLWADRTGEQKEKWTIRPASTKLIPMAAFDSFREPQADRLLEPYSDPAPVGGFSDPPVSAIPRLAMSVLISQNTGETLPTVSVPIDREKPKSETGVAIIVPHFISLIDRVVPAGLGYAVVKDDGTVMFHSDRRRNLHENFIEETDHDGVLRAVVFAKREEFVNATYQGRSHRLYVRPLPGTPWSVIIFRDKELARTLNLEALAVCILTLVCALGAYLFALLVIRVVSRNDDGGWLWPDRARRGVYLHTAVVLLALGSWYLWWLFHCRSTFALLITTIDLPLFAAVFSFMMLHDHEQVGPWRHRVGWTLMGIVVGVMTASAWISTSATLAILGVSLLACASLALKHRAEIGGVVGRLAPQNLTVEYVLLVFAFLLVVAVLPSVALFRDAIEQSTEMLARLRALAVVEQLAARVDRVKQKYREVGEGRTGNEEFVARRLRTTLDLPPSSLLTATDGRILLVSPDCGKRRSSPVTRTGGELPKLAAWLLRDRCQPPTVDQTSVSDPMIAAACGAFLRHFTAPLWAKLPVLNEESRRLRDLVYHRAGDDRWTSMVGERCLTVLLEDSRFHIDDSVSGRGTGAARLGVPAVLSPPGAFGYLVGLLVVILSAGIGFAIVGYLSRRVFGTDVTDEQLPIGTEIEKATGRFYLRPRGRWAEELTWCMQQPTHVIDLYKLSDPSCWRTFIEDPRIADAPLVGVDHLDYRSDDPAWNRAKLALLEALVLHENKSLVVASELDLIGYFYRRLRSPGDPATEENYVTAEEIDRWARVLARLQKIRSDVPDRDPQRISDPSTVAARAREALHEECTWTGRLRGISEEILNDPRSHRLSKEELISHAGDLAQAHYCCLWSSCTDDERLVMFHLATEGFVNPRNWNIVRRLMRRGFVRHAGAFRLMNESFRRFAASIESDAKIRVWEHAAGSSAWDKLRSALVATVFVVGVLLFITQPDELTRWLAFLPAIAGAAATLSRLLAFIPGARGAPQRAG